MCSVSGKWLLFHGGEEKSFLLSVERLVKGRFEVAVFQNSFWSTGDSKRVLMPAPYTPYQKCTACFTIFSDELQYWTEFFCKRRTSWLGRISGRLCQSSQLEDLCVDGELSQNLSEHEHSISDWNETDYGQRHPDWLAFLSGLKSAPAYSKVVNDFLQWRWSWINVVIMLWLILCCWLWNLCEPFSGLSE
jgi:hypothetical protein